MASTLYTVYAVAALVVAVGGLLGVVFMTPSGRADESRDYGSAVFALVAAIFIVALVGEFLV